MAATARGNGFKSLQISMSFALFVGAVIVGLAGCAGQAVQSERGGCPRVELGETPEDCPWAEVARTLGAEIDAGRPVGSKMEALLPGMLAQVRKDAALPQMLALWGTSINYDELAKGEIIRPEIVDVLLAEGKVAPRNGRYVHAGLEHSYGYLLSILKTPYGYKRARWVREDIEKGFGLSRGTLGPQPAEGTLLQNLSFLAARIALDGNLAAQKVLAELRSKASKEVVGLPLESYSRRRLEETVKLGERTIRLRTDFVFFPQTSSTTAVGPGNVALLVYSVHEKQKGQLITAFPVAQGFIDGVFKSENLGDGKPVTTRYNAFVEGLTGLTPPAQGRREEVTPRRTRCEKKRC